MCGICGIAYADRARPIDRCQLIAMRDALVHRGPDDAGIFVADGIGLGTRRLAILDLSARGHMPMCTTDGRFAITYNGEIYNYRELRRDLESKGVTFHSDTDTEVLLTLFVREGESMLDRLNGMFAFAIWDAERAELFAARDRVGVKPLYYCEQNGGFYFASEEKALFAAGIPADFDGDTWTELLCFKYVAGERTPFVGVKRLLPGHSLRYARGRVQIRRWWRFRERVEELRSLPRRDAARWFQETFDNAVDVRRISDVSVGVLLSGGLDSGCVAASLAAGAGDRVASFTVRFGEPGFDEGPAAREVVRAWRLDAHELTLSSAAVADRLPRASWLNGAPLAHASDIHLGAIAEHAKPIVTVLLSGEGADELLGGYIRYQPLRHAALLKTLRPVLSAARSWSFPSHRTRKLARLLGLRSLRDAGLFNACDVLPGDLESLGLRPSAEFPYREQIWDEAEALYPGNLMRQAMFSDQHTFLCSLLDRNDRMTMGASIECRVPFLDYRLVEGIAALEPRELFAPFQRKQLLRRTAARRLPLSVVRQKKWGFGVPWARYLRELPALRSTVQGITQVAPIRGGPLDLRRVAALVERFLAGDDGPAEIVRQLVMMAAWHGACCGRGAKSAPRSAYTVRRSGPRAHRLQTVSAPAGAPDRRAADSDPDRSARARPAPQSIGDRADRTAVPIPRAR
jgi:asparagine synthase (glutamine-hydrolysing)